MSGMIPMAMYGLTVPCGDVAISGNANINAPFRITMAAIDPTAEPEEDGVPPRATLRVLRHPLGAEDFDEDDDDEDDFDADEMDRILAEEEDEDDDDDEDDEVNGGPSDPAKSKKALKAEAILKKLKEADGMDVDEEPLTNGTSKSAKAKGKMPASDEDEDEDDEDDEDDDDIDLDDDEGEMEEFVICTLDPTKNYQQPLDLTFGEDEPVFFQVTGTHSVYLTGNYVEPADNRPGMYDPEDDEDEDYDLEPSEDELEDDEDEEEDELDDMEDPRITELGDDEEDEAPKLIKAEPKADKKSNKRPAEETIDEMIAKESGVNGEQKLSKKQLKKMKKNDGTAVTVEKTEEKPAEAPSSAKSDKKVQFAKNLEQGPTPTKKEAEEKKSADSKDKPKAALGVKTVQGVTIDDKKLGTGPAAKNGDRVGMRYIGKLQKDSRVFDSNKKGKPFSFKLGSGEVIKGWDIGIQGMSVGGERRVTIPAHLAYGSKGAGKDIPPNSTLIFDVKLLELNKGK